MEELQFAFRDEKVNIFAMTYGELNNDYSHQIILCKKKPLLEGRKGPFLLDPKRSKPVHKLSEKGVQYANKIKNSKYDLKYIAYVETQIKVKITIDLFRMLEKTGFFSIWTKEAPYKYFNGAEVGYLVLFRVYEINTAINEVLLEKGRKGRHFYFKLNKITLSDIITPVILDNEYYLMKRELITLLTSNRWCLELEKSSTLAVPEMTVEYLIQQEVDAIVKNSVLSSEELIDKAAEKEAKQLDIKELLKRSKNNKRPKSKGTSEIVIYYRDPFIKELVKRLAEGKCQLCSETAPFKDKDGKPYLEEHHVVHLADGGEDAIGNVAALCPNCHRKIHILRDECDYIILVGIAENNEKKANNI